MDPIGMVLAVILIAICVALLTTTISRMDRSDWLALFFQGIQPVFFLVCLLIPVYFLLDWLMMHLNWSAHSTLPLKLAVLLGTCWLYQNRSLGYRYKSQIEQEMELLKGEIAAGQASYLYVREGQQLHVHFAWSKGCMLVEHDPTVGLFGNYEVSGSVTSSNPGTLGRKAHQWAVKFMQA